MVELLASCNAVAQLAFPSVFHQIITMINSSALSGTTTIAQTLEYTPTHAMHKHIYFVCDEQVHKAPLRPVVVVLYKSNVGP